jgi:hypothetical protein
VRDAVDHNESKGHLDIKLAPPLVQRARQGRTSLKLLDAARHRVIEPAPVRRAKMLRRDQIETLPERLRGAEPEQRRRDWVSTALPFPIDPRRSPHPQPDRECFPKASLDRPRAALNS